MSLPLLQTKFHVPTLRPTVVARPHLIAKLNAGRTGKLTLVAAANGGASRLAGVGWGR
jgi:ATP/maltotriose-dependent transcriptional regulator MalT